MDKTQNYNSPAITRKAVVVYLIKKGSNYRSTLNFMVFVPASVLSRTK